MKTLRYLLMIVALVSVLGAYAQGLAQQPEAQMRSTSGMVYSGSTLPQAAATGATLAGETPAAYSATGKQVRHSRKSLGDGDDDITIPDDNVDPDPTPLGDGLWALMLLAIAFAFGRVLLKRKRAIR